MKRHRASLLFLLLYQQATAQSTISSSDHHGYAANAGWINFLPSPADGVVVSETFLSGHAYAANFGWIHLGDGTPDNGHSYSNTSATDFGVNMDENGLLTGHAYGANIGWIQFEQTHGKPKLNLLTGAFGGHAYSANVGWISLDATSTRVMTARIASTDSDGDGIGDAWELLRFGNLTAAGATSDKDGDGESDHDEFLAGTDPEDSGSRFRIISQAYTTGASPAATFTFTSSPNRLYSIQSNTGLSGSWVESAMGTFAPDAGETTSRTILHDGGARRFFRVQAHRPLAAP